MTGGRSPSDAGCGADIAHGAGARPLGVPLAVFSDAAPVVPGAPVCAAVESPPSLQALNNAAVNPIARICGLIEARGMGMAVSSKSSIGRRRAVDPPAPPQAEAFPLAAERRIRHAVAAGLDVASNLPLRVAVRIDRDRQVVPAG